MTAWDEVGDELTLRARRRQCGGDVACGFLLDGAVDANGERSDMFTLAVARTGRGAVVVQRKIQETDYAIFAHSGVI